MSVNIMDLVKGAVSDQVMGQLGGLLGQGDQTKTKSLFEGAAASILGGLMNKVGTPAGSQAVFDHVNQADDSILDKLGDLLGGGDQTQQVQQRGQGVLDMVFGNQQTGLVDTLVRAFGLDKSMVGKLLTLAAPILMSVVGRHVKSKALDMVGLGNMLGAQKQHLGGYLPAGVGDSLGLSNLASSASTSSRPAPAPQASQSGGGSLGKILIPLLLLGALAFGAYKLATSVGPQPEIEDVEELDIDLGDGAVGLGGLDLSGLTGEAGEQLRGLSGQFSDIKTGFENLADADGANALKDKIAGVTGSVGALDLSSFPEVAKTSATTMLGQFAETIRGLIDGVQNETLKGILQPAVDSLLEKLTSMAG